MNWWKRAAKIELGDGEEADAGALFGPGGKFEPNKAEWQELNLTWAYDSIHPDLLLFIKNTLSTVFEAYEYRGNKSNAKWTDSQMILKAAEDGVWLAINEFCAYCESKGKNPSFIDCESLYKKREKVHINLTQDHENVQDASSAESIRNGVKHQIEVILFSSLSIEEKRRGEDSENELV